MKIMHFSLGLPPFRTGGLNRYCMDLMKQQVLNGNEVSILFPGEYTFYRKVYVKEEKLFDFRCYRIINPLPVPLSNGVSEPKRYIKHASQSYFENFLKHINPDVIHVHTLQGFYREIFDAAKKLKIKMIFTTHDYYAFCPVCVLLYKNNFVCQGGNPEKCLECNAGRGLTRIQEVIMQSRIYEKIKYSSILSRIRKQQRSRNNERTKSETVSLANEKDYADLLSYYQSILMQMDIIHCNSNVAKKAYENMFPNLSYKVVPITHAGLSLHRTSTKVGGTINITFLGGLDSYKGFDILLKAVLSLDTMHQENWKLWLYGADFSSYCVDKRINNGGYFAKEQENEIWNKENQLLVVPSQCQETFGFVVLEGLSHGVPVICSDLVGAKMMVPAENIFQHDNPEALAHIILNHSKDIRVMETDITMDYHCNQINKLYRKE